MGFDADEEILQDFLVEAGEILELLSEQLVELEQTPNDMELLNAIFRGFHTVKGGAGFLQLTPLVDCCHVAENIFDLLRNQKQRISANLMDAVLRSLDSIMEMFEQVSHGQMPEPAPSELIEELETYAVACSPQQLATQAQQEQQDIQDQNKSAIDDATSTAAQPQDDQEGITDADFERLLNALGPKPDSQQSSQDEAPGASTPDNTDLFDTNEPAVDKGNDDITEEEFEALLDQLDDSKKQDTTQATTTSSLDEPSEKQADSDITDDEFEKLLDQLHGTGKFNVDSALSLPTISQPELTQQQKPDSNSEAVVSQSNSLSVSADSLETLSSASALNAKEANSTISSQANKSAAGIANKQNASSKLSSAPGVTKNPNMPQETTVRVDTKRLDDIMNMVGELVLVRNRLVRLGTQLEDEVLAKAVANLNVVTADLQTSVMKTRMQPIKKVFGRFPRVVRDLARNLKKEVNLELIGEETDLDKNLVDALADPLVHLVRNAVDHGIELPAIREKAHKPRAGSIQLSAQQEGDHILLSIEDDGAGMDANKLRDIAVEKGLMDREAAERLPDNECYALIFAPGFSTKKEISDISGRGVGMDVVKTKIAQLNGTLNIDSELGRGSKILIKVPLTLAIMPTLMVMLDEQAFALPLVNVNEIFHLDLGKTSVVDGKEVVIVRGKPLPLFYLKRWLIKGAAQYNEATIAHVVVVSVGNQKVGFVVDQLVGQEEVVIKPLGKMLHGTEGMAGATITGDGRIALILDVPSMLNRYA